MSDYVPNRRCPCLRCKADGMMGPALLVVAGVLLLLDNLDAAEFHQTWPALLIAVGGVKLMQTSASLAGHRPAGVPPEPPPAPGAGLATEAGRE